MIPRRVENFEICEEREGGGEVEQGETGSALYFRYTRREKLLKSICNALLNRSRRWQISLIASMARKVASLDTKISEGRKELESRYDKHGLKG